ncbi:nitrogenase component 1 [Neomoorella thermoacetica]|uniref:nitrogenase component 1 n=1 Tax=Neomoorella thermoacetica TaxID=1525 RepID=UPI0008FB9F55|nr:nitrogenase component 1 [Moorella thermoacetica]APC07667.1 nitrogenase molybdenum-iron protein beta chain [Moorella thermoacetica]OIQ53628.1 nitrogenase molybdenum-iron protein beta chain [Moorella thermoacetica]
MQLKEIPITGIPYDQLYIEKIPATPEYCRRPAELLPAGNRSVVVNPNRTCMPLGAMWAVLGVHGAIPFVQGAQGCTTYVRYTFCRVFKEPATIATASFHEDAAVFGGRRNLIEGIRNLVVRYWPELIGVVTTCSSEIIGDDMVSFLKMARANLRKEIGPEKADRIPIVLVNTPSFAGSHVDGYDRASRAFVETLATVRDKPSGKVNIIPGLLYPGDIREIKHLLRHMDIEGIVLFDISDPLDAPLQPPVSLPYKPPGGTPVEAIRDMANSLATFALQPHAGQAGARYLERKFGVRAVVGPPPIGIQGTDAFLKTLRELTGKPIPESLLQERGRLVDSLADTFHHTMMKKVAIMGDPDVVLGVTRFVLEMGMEPVALAGGTASKTFDHDVEAILAEAGYGGDPPLVVNGGDLLEFEEHLKQLPRLDLVIGNSRAVDIAKELQVPLVRVGFPIYDRFGYQKRAVVGYRGGEVLLAEIVNSILGYQYPDDRTHQL